MAELSTTKILLRPLGIAASLIAISQGIAWSILAFLKILIHNDVWQWDFDLNTTYTYTGNLKMVYYAAYLGPIGNQASPFRVTPNALQIWACFYLPLSLVWVVSSCLLFWVLFSRKWEKIVAVLTGWVIITSVVSFLDLILTFLLVHDYDYYINNYNDKVTDIQALPYYFLACGTMMTVAIRGFILWIFNVTFAALFAKYAFVFMSQASLRNHQNKDSMENNLEDYYPEGINNQPFHTRRSASPDDDVTNFTFSPPSTSTSAVMSRNDLRNNNFDYRSGGGGYRRFVPSPSNARSEDDAPNTPSYITSSHNPSVFYTSGADPTFDGQYRKPDYARSQSQLSPGDPNRKNNDNFSFSQRTMFKR